MTITVPKLKNHNPVLVAPSIPSHPIQPSKWTWQDYLRELELKYNTGRNTFATTEVTIKFVNEIMQDLYPGPYCVVERYLPDRMVFGLILEFDDPKEQTFWLLRNS
jgi:hypothetical protein